MQTLGSQEETEAQPIFLLIEKIAFHYFAFLNQNCTKRNDKV